MAESANIYSPMPAFVSTTRSMSDEREDLDHEVPEGFAPSAPPPLQSHGARSCDYGHVCFSLPSTPTIRIPPPVAPPSRPTNNKKVKSQFSADSPPTLPPRIAPSVQIPNSQTAVNNHYSIYDHPKNQPSTSPTASPTAAPRENRSPDSSDHLYSTLESPSLLDAEVPAPATADVSVTPVKRGYSVPCGTLNIKLTRQRCVTSDGSSPRYASPCGTLTTVATSEKDPTCQNNTLDNVNLTIHEVPYGKVYKLQKMGDKFDAGLILHKHKIRLADVLEGSLVWNVGIRATVPAVTHSGSAPACITCINGQALNLFSKNDEILKRIDSLPNSTSFSVIVQPYDFVKLLKKNLQKMKNFDEFLY
ncbi:unnamed protein product [Gongylonema pulchrum]|uniref:PDZ domain-containing protein n=1 Tax=Gongylonema pulchrum TaxID=637853 RepID=A0A183DT70_9BILA|nr:unnamed protein product [Gongylonema pulchrum]